ncbi:MAG: response regulator transcription factor [Spirochaetaceae bacterium]|jgi:DNA-binding NarL/FixJ family response regulator|nr:response regulator transcription factor [Spirochaetaceae bacterium]
MIRIVIITEKDSERYTKFIDSQSDISLVGQGQNGYDAIKVVSCLKPDITLLDETLYLADSTKITLTLKYRVPAMKIIILASAQENLQVLKAISCGASGCLLKNSLQERFIAGIKTVYHGGCLMTQETAAKAFTLFPYTNRDSTKASGSPTPQEMPFPLYANLSRQELQIIACISKGLSNREIGEYLPLKAGTIRNYISTILEKTGFKNRTQIAVYSCNAGFTGEPG